MVKNIVKGDTSGAVEPFDLILEKSENIKFKCNTFVFGNRQK